MRINSPLLLLNLLVIILMTACHDLSNNKPGCDSLHVNFHYAPGEVADKYLITPDGKLVFSYNDSDNYSFKIYQNRKSGQLMSEKKNVFNPFLLLGEISGLQDFEGDEEFVPLNSMLNEYTAGRAVKSIFSFNNGKKLILELKNEKTVLLYDPVIQQGKTLLADYQKLNGIFVTDDSNYLIISFDDQLLLYDCASDNMRSLADRMKGEKLNPYISGTNVYFVNNSLSQYFCVYSVSISNNSNNVPANIFSLDTDIRMPKTKDGYLYFIEVARSEYILKRMNLVTLEMESITKEGVVYNYDFFVDSLISMVYSDLKTPKSLILYDINSQTTTNISGFATENNITAKFLKNSNISSSAWLLADTINYLKGIILFIHPGLHSDFSPRWDNILMNLCSNGYYIIAPNSAMSYGYGKSFMNQSVTDAIIDLKEWKDFIVEHFNGIPIYYMAASSGNILMEQLLEEGSREISAAVSLFGVPGNVSDKSVTVPVLYILGENDPVVNFNIRHSQLDEMASKSRLTIVSYKDEGHWFRKNKNIEDAVLRILKHLCTN